MNGNAIALLSAQLRAHGGKVVPNQADGHNVYGATGVQLASVQGSTAGPDGSDHGREQLADILRMAVLLARTSSGRYIFRLSDTPGWVDILDGNTAVASCSHDRVGAVIAGLADHEITGR